MLFVLNFMPSTVMANEPCPRNAGVLYETSNVPLKFQR